MPRAGMKRKIVYSFTWMSISYGHQVRWANKGRREEEEAIDVHHTQEGYGHKPVHATGRCRVSVLISYIS
jgi:hypothetical protein